eukprot:518801-Lingulodinium_polyedra.AAC.1
MRDKLAPGAEVYPCLAAFPMGFTWSLWTAQRCGERQLDVVPGTCGALRATDFSEPIILALGRPPRRYLY